MTEAIELDHVYAEIAGQTVLEDISLAVNTREFYAIIGPNGGGKTTLVKLMLGLIEPKMGMIKVFGGTPRANRRMLGYVPQFHTFDFHYPITLEEMVISGRLGNKSRVFTRYTKEDCRITEEVLITLGISDLSGREISALSNEISLTPSGEGFHSAPPSYTQPAATATPIYTDQFQKIPSNEKTGPETVWLVLISIIAANILYRYKRRIVKS